MIYGMARRRVRGRERRGVRGGNVIALILVKVLRPFSGGRIGMDGVMAVVRRMAP